MSSKAEKRALTLLSQEIGFDAIKWPGKEKMLEMMESYPDVSHPEGPILNDAGDIWESSGMGSLWGHIVPDGCFIFPQAERMFLGWDPRRHHLCIVEVETTAKMSDEKIWCYGKLWDIFSGDSEAWEFHVIAWDWYDQWREIDLLRFFYRSIRKPQPDCNMNDLRHFENDKHLYPEIVSNDNSQKFENGDNQK